MFCLVYQVQIESLYHEVGVLKMFEAKTDHSIKQDQLQRELRQIC